MQVKCQSIILNIKPESTMLSTFRKDKNFKYESLLVTTLTMEKCIKTKLNFKRLWIYISSTTSEIKTVE